MSSPADRTCVAMVGGGSMGGAIVEGIVSGVPDARVIVVDANEELAEKWRSRGDVEVLPLADAVSGATVVFLAVKPPQITEVLREAAPDIRPGTAVVSIAAGVPLSSLESCVGEDVAVVRAMPNTPVRVGRGAVGVAAGRGCTDETLEKVSALLGPVATVVTLPESSIDALTATSGSGPAYVFYLAEAMNKAAVDLGLDAATASTLVAETILGAGLLLAASPDDPAALRAAVTSKGGTTAAATRVFDERGLPDIVWSAMQACVDRAEEMVREQADVDR